MEAQQYIFPVKTKLIVNDTNILRQIFPESARAGHCQNRCTIFSGIHFAKWAINTCLPKFTKKVASRIQLLRNFLYFINKKVLVWKRLDISPVQVFSKS